MLSTAIAQESRQFETYYLWFQESMSQAFFEELQEEYLTLIARTLIDFKLRKNYQEIFLERLAIVLTLDEPNSDLGILKNFRNYGIKNFFSFVSLKKLPGYELNLKVALVYFTEGIETVEKPFPEESKKMLKEKVSLSDVEFHSLMHSMNTRFLNSLRMDMLVIALEMYMRAKNRDTCQYEIIQNTDYKEKNIPSLQIVFAWKGAPKFDFLYHIAHIIHQHDLVLKRVNATYIDPYGTDTILIMALGINGKENRPAWENADIQDFVKELVTAKYFSYFDTIGSVFVLPKLLSGNEGNFLRTVLDFVHQILVTIDMHLYSRQNCEEALCRHPELTKLIVDAFDAKFNPKNSDLHRFNKIKEEFYFLISKLDTGNEVNDQRRKSVLQQGMVFVDNTLKTNVYQNNKSAFAYRLKPAVFNHNIEKFPELPFGLFFIVNKDFFSFHVRFADLARGGVRTIFTDQIERAQTERNHVLTECYNLALTQDKKNKDIPEGGAKAVIFINPFEKHKQELPILINELKNAGFSDTEIEERFAKYQADQKLEHLYTCQRAFVRNLLTLVNCEDSGKLIAKNIIDYWNKPEYLYLGPDENMHDSMIEWIARYSVSQNYKPLSAFISGKPDVGINHKHYGVTSLGVNIYMIEALKYLGIDPYKEEFTVKISGGPDGDVAGNQIKNLYQDFKKTAKILAITDISGTIRDPQGLNLEELNKLVHEGKPIKYYPAEKLSEEGFLLDKETKKEVSKYAQLTLLKRISQGKVLHEWISGNEMNQIFRTNVHQVISDVFIPAGGRPKTLNKDNFTEFLDLEGNPTSKIIVEGANLYLTQEARTELESLGVLIIKDSSANKTGVICSSFEILSGLTLHDAEFLRVKKKLIPEILQILKEKASDEALLLIETHKKTHKKLTEISNEISSKINFFFHQLFDYLLPLDLTQESPLIQCYFQYCPPLLRSFYQKELMQNVPDNHKKAIIATYLASRLVYKRGLAWQPTLVDILPLLIEDSTTY